MCSFFPASLPTGQRGRNSRGEDGRKGLLVTVLVTAQSPSEVTSLQKHHVPATYLCLHVLALQSPPCYLGKMQFNIKLTPAPRIPWGFPPCAPGAAPASAAEVGPQSKGSRWGFTEKQLGSTQHLKVSLVKSPSSRSTGVLGRELETSVGSALPSPRRRRGAGASTLWGGHSKHHTWENGEPKAPANFYQGGIQQAKFGTLWRTENYKGMTNFIALKNSNSMQPSTQRTKKQCRNLGTFTSSR